MSQLVPAAWPPVVENQPQGSTAGFAYAGVAPRLGALLVDGIVLWLIMMPIYLVLQSAAGMEQGSSAAMLVVFGAAFTYFTLSWALNHGQTPGMRVARVRVVRRDGGSAIGLGRSAVRTVGLYITLAFWFISLLAVLIGREKRSPADALAGTVVITSVQPQVPGAALS